MPNPPDRWLHMHPGDSIIEKNWSLTKLVKTADRMAADGYRFSITTFEGDFMIVCEESPRPLILGALCDD